jgi:hypothetical protein
MSRTALLSLALALASVVAFGCSSSTTAHSKDAASARDAHDDAREVDQASAETTAEEAAAASASRDRRQVGDYVTFTFSGSYRKAPLALTQRVVEKDASTITVDYLFSYKKSKETLRVTSKIVSRDVLSVMRVADDGSTKPVDRAAFEAKISETVAVADENEALVTEEPAKISIAGSEIDATRSVYKVRIGKKAATLKTLASEGFAWGDLGGEIVTADGKVFYKAELVDAGGAAGATALLDR